MEASHTNIAQEDAVDLRKAQPVHIPISDEAHGSGPDARRLEQDLEVFSLPQKAEHQLTQLALSPGGCSH